MPFVICGIHYICYNLGRWSLGGDYLKLDKNKLAFMTVCMIFGIMIAIQLKTAINIVGFNVFPNQKLKELLKEYDIVKGKKDSAEQYIEELDAEIREYEKEEARDNKVIQSKYAELEKYRIFAGYEDVTGPGVTLEIRDPELKAEAGKDISFIVENYNFILQIITILNDNGAEAISINDQRYTNFTELVPKGNTLLVNDIAVKPPIVINAIGSPEELERGLKIRGNIVWDMENTLQYGISIKRMETLEVLKYGKKEEHKYAKPVNLN